MPKYSEAIVRESHGITAVYDFCWYRIRALEVSKEASGLARPIVKSYTFGCNLLNFISSRSL